MGGAWGRAGSWPFPAHCSQQLIRDSNQAEIFSRQLITNSNKVPAPGRGCFFPAGDNDEQLVGAFGNSFVITCSSQKQESFRVEEESRGGDGGRVPFAEDRKVNMPDALGKPSPLPNGHLESSGNLGPALCEVQTSSNYVWK